MNMSNSCAFIGVGVVMGALRFAPGITSAQLAWLAVMGGMMIAVGVGCSARLVWRSTLAGAMKRMRTARAAAMARAADGVPADEGAAQIV